MEESNPGTPPVTEENLSTALQAVWPGLRAYVVSILAQHRDMADDVLQETAIHVWEHKSELPSVQNFNKWIFRIAYFKVLSSRRDLARRAELQLSDEAFDILEKSASDLLSKGYEKRLATLESCMGKLKKDDLHMLVWHYYEKRQLTELATMAGRSVNSIHLRISRLRRALRLCVENNLGEANHG
ncbi:MAG: sigma-70 family RNA polymerase sigma factor [Puniceicoccales bacterium]|jgi:RNA polymerase sigma-70 factor (ECF subfamily)|nr:sigma-70 family RNA polymerase sigma factor [Puniceicoccales bacterium]